MVTNGGTRVAEWNPSCPGTSAGALSTCQGSQPAWTTDSYQLLLTRQPTATITIEIGSVDGQLKFTATRGEANGNGWRITFDSTNWNIPVTVTVSAVDDGAIEGPRLDVVTHTVTTGDAATTGNQTDVTVADYEISTVLMSRWPTLGGSVTFNAVAGQPGKYKIALGSDVVGAPTARDAASDQPGQVAAFAAHSDGVRR